MKTKQDISIEKVAHLVTMALISGKFRQH
jgi:hypothetical protein